MVAKGAVRIALVFLAFTIGVWVARASVGAPRWAAHEHAVIVRCDGWAEDSAAHLRLVSFDHAHAYYVCRTRGY